MSRSPFDITHALECHGQALRQLALELVRDANVADDAVQEVWLAALQRPPRHQDALRGWFATALHNVVRVWRRKQLRRARHEAAVADRERVDRGESVAREEIGRRLLTAVESLAAPYREVVWQRYFEGKAPREIAAALREPLATVKSRLQRGLAMLRERLGEGADGGDWQRAFVVAFGLREGTAAASVAAVMTGGVLVATWTKGLAAAVAAIAVVVMLWWPRDAVVPPVVAAGESAAGAMAQRAAPGAQVVAGEAASGEHVPRREAVASASPDEAKVATIRGRCVDEAGNAIAGCTASLLGYGGRSDESAQDDWVLEHGDERLEQNTRTAVDGTFELAFVPPPPFVVFLSLQGEGWARIGRSWDRIEPGAVHDLGTIVMTPGVLVRGRVVDAAGQPLEWLQVDTERGPTPMTRPASTLAPASYAAARTKENGAFAFDLSLPPGAYALRLSGDYRVASPSPLVLDGKVPVIDIEVRTAPLPEVPTITGVVADDAERPVWGALVTWQQQGGAVVDGSYSGRDGRFTLRCKTGSAAEPVRIVASQYGHVTATLADAVAWGSRDVRVRMQRGADLTVRIHDVQGRPVAGAAVRLMPGDAAQWGMTHGVAEKARTDAGGQATMTRIVPGTYLVVVQFAPSRGLLPIFERVVVDRAPVRLELRVGMESSRRLRVQRTDGRFVAGAQVQLCEMLGNAFGPKCLLLPRARWFQSNNLPRILVIAELETDADGAALLRGPGGRALGLRVSGAGHLGIELDDLRLDVAGDLLVTVPSGARLHGAVVPPEAVAELRRLAGGEVGEAISIR